MPRPGSSSGVITKASGTINMLETALSAELGWEFTVVNMYVFDISMLSNRSLTA